MEKIQQKELISGINEKTEDTLELRFQDYFLKNPGFPGVFNPDEELIKIKSLKKEEKRKALDAYKQKLEIQRSAWAECRIFIEELISFDNNIDKKSLISWVEKFSNKYGFSEKYIKIAERFIEEFSLYRRNSLDIRKRFPDNTQLVNKIFKGLNADQNKNFEVLVGPMEIDIVADIEDAKKIYDISSKIKTPEEKGRFKGSGFAINTEVDGIKIFCTVLVREGHYPTTPRHELEHHKNKLFANEFDKQVDFFDRKTIQKFYFEEKDDDLRALFLKTYFETERSVALNRVKDELIAMKNDGRQRNDYLKRFLKGGDCDYLEYLRDYKEKKDDEYWQKMVEKILVVDYIEIISNAISAFDDLENIGGYKKDKVVALIFDKPLLEWPKVSKRLIEIGNKRNS